MTQKGKLRWLPPLVIDEMNNIKSTENIDSGAEALRKMAKYSKIGRTDFFKEIKKIRDDDNILGSKKKRKDGFDFLAGHW